jgi:putative alpha-1,2-mannosidase
MESSFFPINKVIHGFLLHAKEHPLSIPALDGRTHNFENLWDKDMTAEGFKGFLRPRNPDGSWAAPYLVVRGTWPDFFYEGDIWTYSIYAPQDMRRLIEMAGG